jgi:hypothetical protein
VAMELGGGEVVYDCDRCMAAVWVEGEQGQEIRY